MSDLSNIDRRSERAIEELKLYSQTEKWLIHVFRMPAGRQRLFELPSCGWEPVTFGASSSEISPSLVWPIGGDDVAEFPVIQAIVRFVVHLKDLLVVDLPLVAEQIRRRTEEPIGLDKSPYRSILGAPVFDPVSLRPDRATRPIAAVVTFTSEMPASDLVQNERLRRVASKHAELLAEATADATTQAQPLTLKISELLTPQEPLHIGKKMSAGWTEFLSGGYAPEDTIQEYNRNQSLKQASAEYYQHYYKR